MDSSLPPRKTGRGVIHQRLFDDLREQFAIGPVALMVQMPPARGCIKPAKLAHPVAAPSFRDDGFEVDHLDIGGGEALPHDADEFGPGPGRSRTGHGYDVGGDNDRNPVLGLNSGQVADERGEHCTRRFRFIVVPKGEGGVERRVIAPLRLAGNNGVRGLYPLGQEADIFSAVQNAGNGAVIQQPVEHPASLGIPELIIA